MLALGLGCGALVVNAPAASASPHDGGQASRPGHAGGWGPDHSWIRHAGPAEGHEARGLDVAAALGYRHPDSPQGGGDGHTPPPWARQAWRQPESWGRPETTTTARPPGQSHSNSVQDRPTEAAAVRTPILPPRTTPPTTTARPGPPSTTVTTVDSPPTTLARAAQDAATRAGVRRTTPSTTVPPASIAAIRPVVIYRSTPTAATVPVRPAAPSQPSRVTPPPVVEKPAVPAETFPGAFGEPMVLARGAWQGLSLRAATELRLPISLLVVVAAFLLVQALVDRRDPKVAAAPERGTDDTVGFQ